MATLPTLACSSAYRPAEPDAEVTPDAAMDAGTASDVKVANDADIDADASLLQFTDTFDRPSSLLIGNGWLSPDFNPFSIKGNRLEKRTTTQAYAANLILRPASENQLNVETSVEFLTGSGDCTPQLYARAQLTPGGGVNAYFIYSDPPGPAAIARTVAIARHDGSSYVDLSTQTTTSGFAADKSYRYTLAAQNEAGGVRIRAAVAEQVGPGWSVLYQFDYLDSTPMKIALPGSTGVSARPAAGPSYDNFTWRQLP
jgi:hypothetical protein